VVKKSVYKRHRRAQTGLYTNDTDKSERRCTMAKKRVRVRSKRLTQLDDSKLALAIWLIARDLVENKTSPPPELSGGEPPRLAGEEAA